MRPGLPISLLIAANLLPVAGVLWLDWDVFGLLLLFWFENVVIGIYGIARIILSGADRVSDDLIAPLFFLAHYGLFMFVHFMVLFGLYETSINLPGGEVAGSGEPLLRAAGVLGQRDDPDVMAAAGGGGQAQVVETLGVVGGDQGAEDAVPQRVGAPGQDVLQPRLHVFGIDDDPGSAVGGGVETEVFEDSFFSSKNFLLIPSIAVFSIFGFDAFTFP